MFPEDVRKLSAWDTCPGVEYLTKFVGGICSVYRGKFIENWDEDMEERLVI